MSSWVAPPKKIILCVADGCVANGHELIVETRFDTNIAKRHNIMVTDFGLLISRVVMGNNTDTAAHTYNLWLCDVLRR